MCNRLGISTDVDPSFKGMAGYGFPLILSALGLSVGVGPELVGELDMDVGLELVGELDIDVGLELVGGLDMDVGLDGVVPELATDVGCVLEVLELSLPHPTRSTISEMKMSIFMRFCI